MAVKIVKIGVTLEERVWGGTCNDCGTVIECLGKDLASIHHLPISKRPYSWMKCPICNNKKDLIDPTMIFMFEKT